MHRKFHFVAVAALFLLCFLMHKLGSLFWRDAYCAWDIKPTAIKLSEAEMASILQSVLTWMNGNICNNLHITAKVSI
jgi:hypothetical protein